MSETRDVSPNEVTPNPWNPNIVDPDTLPKLRKSLETDGFTAPIIVRDTELGLEIVDGEHRWKLAKEMSLETIPVRNLGAIDDLKAKRVSILLNARYGTDDVLLLAKAMEGQSIEDWSALLPTDEADLAAMLDAVTIDLDGLDLEDGDDEIHEPVESAPQTHRIMRFKVAIEDAESITALIEKTQKTYDYTEADELTNADDALAQLLLIHG